MQDAEDRDVLFFDGKCNLCNSTIDFLIRNELNPKISFCSLQSAEAQSFFSKKNVKVDTTEDSGTLVLFFEKRIYIRSQAVVVLMENLDPPWRIFGSILRIFPTFVADAVYRFIARHRYKWFGKRETCRVPTQAERARFIC